MNMYKDVFVQVCLNYSRFRLTHNKNPQQFAED